MRFDFLTPEIFDLLVIANLTVALLLIGIRFYQDMTHVDKRPAELREQKHDESSRLASETTVLTIDTQTADATQKQTQHNQ